MSEKSPLKYALVMNASCLWPINIIRQPEQSCTLFFYKLMGKLGWSSICSTFSQFDPEIMLDGMLNFKTHFMVWYCVWYEHCNLIVTKGEGFVKERIEDVWTFHFVLLIYLLSSYQSPLHSWNEICDSGKRPSGKCQFGEMSFGKLSVGKKSVGEMYVGELS